MPAPIGLTIRPRGPFDLQTARDFAGGFTAGIGARAGAEGAILMAFPVEDGSGSAVVQLHQRSDGGLEGPVFGDGTMQIVERQAARSLSLDHDGSGWPEVGQRDPSSGASRHATACFDPSASTPRTRRRRPSSSANASRWPRPGGSRNG